MALRVLPTPHRVRGLRLALPALLFASPTFADLPPAEPHGFQSIAEKAEVRLGAPFGYTIQVRHDPADHYELEGQPQPSAQAAAAASGPAAFLKLDPFEASEVRCQTEPSRNRNEALTTCRMRLALFDLDEHDVPEVRLVARGPAGDRVLVVPGPRVKGLGVTDTDTPTEQLALRKLAPPVSLLVRSWRLLWWALGLAAGAGLAVAGWMAWKRYRRRPRAPLDSVLLPPHLRYQRRLADLEAERLPARGQRREYFFRLSEVVREYLGALLEVNALDFTTAELVAALPHSGSPIDRVALQRWCEQADLVKFARHPVSEEECDEALRYARELLEQTRPRPEAAA